MPKCLDTILMRRLTTVVLFAAVLFPAALFAQKGNGLYTLEEEPKPVETKKELPKEGTFQFRISKENYSFIISKDFMYEIETLRKQDEPVTVKVDDFVELFIPSRNEIYSSGFRPLEKYTNTSN